MRTSTPGAARKWSWDRTFSRGLTERENARIDLFLTVLSGSSEAITPDNSLRAEQLTNFILEYFRDSAEGTDFPQANDEEGKRLLAWYRDRETVALHPIGDYAQIEIPRISR